MCNYCFMCPKYNVNIGKCSYELENRECDMKSRMDKVYELSYIPEKYRGYINLKSCDDVDIDNWNQLMEFWKNPSMEFDKYHNLLIYSEITGNGKTSWACKIAQKFAWNDQCNSGAIDKSILFFDFPRFFSAIKSNISSLKKDSYVEDIRSRITDVKLVIWDDVGVSANSQWEKDELLNLINLRVDKYNIFTTNYTIGYLKDNKDKIGERFVSRMLSSVTNHLHGSDRRISGEVKESLKNTTSTRRVYDAR